ncbi:bifunctional lysylphosphatidylglycerol flippase/synthetase MprF [Brevirhabdus sp.]|uniref:bifunctional lysylphosphatidylglycerol flippase/synthetase MprF n=1 Tax=Brevirhabdus sp. TaxID=2004514 RepID=UPI00405846D2
MKTAALKLWHKIAPALPIVLTIGLFAGGIYALYHLLKPVDYRQVMAQIRATPLLHIALAILGTIGGYGALIGYDWSALRYIGKRLPLPVVALGGFLGYAFGNTIGLGPVSGGAVRYRIYSALGLTGYDIARIATFGSLAFGFGSSILGLVALAYTPDALRSLHALDPATVRMVALGLLAGTAAGLGYVAIRRSEVRIGGFRITAPSPGLMAGQLGFTGLEVLLASFTLYVLLTPEGLGYWPFVALFAAAMLAGVISHVPGGVGVFETVIIAGLPPQIPVDQAAAGLLLFRLVYFLLPFMVALVALSLSELRMAAVRKPGPRLQALVPVLSAAGAVVPTAMSAMIFASGLFMMLSSVIPAADQAAEELELLLPLGFVEGGALLSSAIGAALVIIAHGLLRRVEGAWWLSVLALAGGVVAALLQGLDTNRALILALALLILLPCRREFYRSTRLTRDTLSLKWVALMLAILGTGLAVFFFAYRATPYNMDLWWQFATDQRAPRAMRAGMVGSLVLALWALVYALRPPRTPLGLATRADLDRAGAVIDSQPNPYGKVALTGDKSILFSDNGRSFLMFRVQGRSWIALGDPIGSPADAAQLCWQFFDAANAANGRPVFYETSSDYLPLWIEMGLSLHKMGEEAVVALADFSLEGSARKKLRTTHSRALRDGLRFELSRPPHAPELIAELREISDRWLSAKDAREKQFSVGRFSPAYLASMPIALVRHEARIVAFANVLDTAQRQKATIDLMRHLPDAPAGVMEFLFTELMMQLRAQGYGEFSLGMAPLSGLATRRGSRWTARMGALVYRHGGHFYNFEGLRAFKNKFDPQWRARYLVAPPRVNVLLVATDLSVLIGGGGSGKAAGRQTAPG